MKKNWHASQSRIYFKICKWQPLDTLRNDLIDKVLLVSNKEFLETLNNLVDNSNIEDEPVKLTEEQILMLKLSDKYVETGQLVLHDEVTKNDLKWLRGYQTTEKRKLKN